MALDKILTNQGARQHHHKEQHPAVLVRVKEAVVVAQHREDDRQGEVGVVHTPLLASLAMDGQRGRVILLTVRHGLDHLALAGNDPE